MAEPGVGCLQLAGASVGAGAGEGEWQEAEGEEGPLDDLLFQVCAHSRQQSPLEPISCAAAVHDHGIFRGRVCFQHFEKAIC